MHIFSLSRKGRIVKKISKNPKLGQNSRSQSSSLRSRLNRRLNPPPKSTGSPVPVKVANILSNLQYVKRKQMAPSQSNQPATEQKPESNNEESDSESESSGDEGLIRPSDIDFDSDMFKAPSKAAAITSSEAPLFDCNAGMKLSDSSASDNDDDEENDFVEASTSNMAETKNRNVLIDKINQKSSDEVHDFSNLEQFAKNLESAKAHLQKIKDKEVNATKSVGGATVASDVAKLLSMGEQKSVVTAASASSRKRKHKYEQPSDDSDWENVSGKRQRLMTDFLIR